VTRGLQCVCRTFESDPSASATLLRQCLEPRRLRAHGFEDMPCLAREVKRLIPLDPQLVEDIYRAAFGYEEKSEAPTVLSRSSILALVSNRRQDYRMALYELAEVFPEFLAHAPQHAAKALIAAMESYVVHHHDVASDEEMEEKFDFDGKLARLRTDYSSMWDEGHAYRYDEPLKMLDAFERHLERLAERKEHSGELHELIQVLVERNRLAVLWRRLLFLGARFPETLGREIRFLAWAVPVLTGRDTTVPAGEFLKAIFPVLSPAERERVERALLSIPYQCVADRRDVGKKMRDCLFGCLAGVDLVTEEARSLLAELRAGNGLLPNELPVRFEETIVTSYSEEEYLAEEGVPVEAEANRKIRELEQPVREFADKHLNSVPTPEEADNVLPALEALWQALLRADADGVHPKQRDHAWGHLAAACGRIAGMSGLSCAEGAGRFVKTVLLAASRNAEPTYDPEEDERFNERPSWGSPAARVSAAEGLVMLACNYACASAEVMEAIERLSADPVPAVRFQIAWRLFIICQTAPSIMWRMIEHMCREEKNRGVLVGLLSTLSRLAGPHLDRVAGLIRAVFDRVTEGPGASEVRERCIRIFTWLYLWRDEPLSRVTVLGLAANSASNPDEAAHMLHDLRVPLTCGPTDCPDPTQDAVRRRTFHLIDRLFHSALGGLRQITAAHAEVSFPAWPEAHQQKARLLARLIDQVASQIYFASGASDNKDQSGTRRERLLTREAQERFYREVAPILDALADVGLPTVAHHLLKTLEAFIPLDPRGVFLRVGRVVRSGQEGGYQYESAAVQLIVNLVERYLAEYRTLLREEEECRRALLEILDVFVRAGWPSARRLVYRLDEIFR